ncbi:MAG: Maf family nucleotide pyrophosphatase [Sphingobacteriaceae bacterium]|nr:Maf family nucleotide pyrophosphatase [Sphingobacteriaceae bacterium]
MLDLPFKLILASASPRRQALLKEMDVEFSVRLQLVDEKYPEDLAAEKVAEYLAGKKAQAYIISDEELLLTADTVVVLEGEVLGKPADTAEAITLLRKQSGKLQTVITGVCLRTTSDVLTFSNSTDVLFNHLTDEEILYYVNKYKPYDKAGGYGIQEWLGNIAIARIEGSYTNVMGLPTEALYNALRSFEL